TSFGSSPPSFPPFPFTVRFFAAAPSAFAPPAATTSAPPPTSAPNAATLRMRRYRNDRDLVLARPIAPENSIGASRLILCVCLKDLLILIVRVWERMVFMRLQPGMTR